MLVWYRLINLHLLNEDYNKHGGITFMKKILTAILTAVLIFSPVGNVIFQDQTTTVEAKSYKSGKRGFNNSNNNTNTNSFFQQKKSNTPTNKSATTTKPRTGGFMRGLMVGGLAGLLFGSLFANMGVLGSILGLFVNILGIIILIAVIRRIFSFFKNKKEDPRPWKG